MAFENAYPIKAAGRYLGSFLLLFCGLFSSFGQQAQRINKEFARGNFINDVRIVILEEETETIASSDALKKFYNAFFIKPGTTFNPIFTDLAMNRIKAELQVKDATYEIFDAEMGSGSLNRPVSIIVYVTLETDTPKDASEAGIFTKNGFSDFPILYRSGEAQFTFFLNGGMGLYNDVNALFGEGAAFTQGNPIANDPAGRETRFWGETFLEPGLSGISKMGGSSVYAYGEASVLASARNTADIYSSGSTAFIAFERLYGGVLITGLGSQKNITVNLNYGRNFFQLNDGFLFSRFSGSSNAGKRGSVYLSSRTAFQKNGNISLQWDKFRFSAHFVEPQELFKDKQVNTHYTIGSVNYNNNKNLDLGFSYVQTTGGKARYSTPSGSIEKKGMYVLNPKLWLTHIAGTGLFFKSEYAFQGHHSEDMKSSAWYAGLGYNFQNLTTTPSVYYRYAFLKGDNEETDTYERFDPILTGGLGNWVQGLNFRKILGNGNLISHRVDITSWLSPSMSLSMDYFYLLADQLNNMGGLRPITMLKNKSLGHETSLTLKGLVKEHLTLLGVVSYSIPEKGLRRTLEDPLAHWLTVQAALFINY